MWIGDRRGMPLRGGVADWEPTLVRSACMFRDACGGFNKWHMKQEFRLQQLFVLVATFGRLRALQGPGAKGRQARLWRCALRCSSRQLAGTWA